ncbi:hypothetical protein [Paraglaciecola sp. L3A3]|uniref:hypothetical protein n=1 Tax=Paraglaciecola sp. L3A3 TaxID=2686358 RepID=UPI00131E5269|nr:hypothetical protein [Paraglaciecola sp. L3A3]
MKYLQHNWKSRAFVLLSISILISLLLITLDQSSWAEQINLQGYSHGGEEGEGEGRSIPAVLRYILPFVKEIILIGVPMLITVILAKLFTKKK